MMDEVDAVLDEFNFGDGVVNAGDRDAERMATEIVRLRRAQSDPSGSGPNPDDPSVHIGAVDSESSTSPHPNHTTRSDQ